MSSSSTLVAFLMMARLASAATDAEVLRVRDLAYLSDQYDQQKLDLYIPQTATKPLPLIIYIHGGGWKYGDKELTTSFWLHYAGQGFAIASIGYRLSDVAPFPAQIEDCKAAIRWLRAHAKEYGLDGARFGVLGHSAGGHLAALAGTSSEVRQLDRGENPMLSSRVQAVVDSAGPTDLLDFVASSGQPSLAIRLIGGPLSEHADAVRQANPITYVSRDDPPFLLIYGEKDLTVPLSQGELLYDALQNSGVASQLYIVRGAGHSAGLDTPAVICRIDEFFERYLKRSSGVTTVRRECR